MISPDGRWIAYTSDESGQDEIYVDAFPGLGARQMVSSQGGTRPEWTRDGKALYWDGPTGAIWSARVTSGERLSAGTPAIWTMPKADVGSWSISIDGERLLACVQADGASQIAPRSS